MPLRRFVPFVVLVLLSACGPQQQPAPTSNPAAAPPAAAAKREPVVPTRPGHASAAIKAEDIAGYVQQLASNEFEGRKPGTIGGRMTTTWLIDQFQGMGLKPGLKDGYLQRVPMVETALVDADKVALEVAEGGGVEHFTYRSDAIVNALQAQGTTEIKDSGIVFLGFGAVAPAFDWDDYAGVDVKGKTVVVLVNDPGFATRDPKLFNGEAMTYYGRWPYKYEEAARHGAAACLVVHDTAGAAYPWDVVVNSWSGPQLSLPVSEDPAPRVPVGGWLTTDAAKRLFAKAGADFDALKLAASKRGFKPVPLAASLSLTLHSEIRNTSSDNVLALVPGSERPDEVVVYSAHWDHFGKDPALPGDPVYHGAVDNGSGVAALLELADAFAHQQPAPKRSVLFLVPTLEESMLLGSRYYVLHPPYPLARTVADINMDELIPWGRTHDMAVMGLGQSQMDDYLRDALKQQGRVAVADEEPGKGMFYRSDQLNFALGGVPVLYARGGFDLLDGGKEAGRKAYDLFTREHYHKPADRYDPQWDWSGVVEDVQVLYAVGRRLADETTFPQWNADSEFRAARDAQAKAARK